MKLKTRAGIILVGALIASGLVASPAQAGGGCGGGNYGPLDIVFALLYCGPPRPPVQVPIPMSVTHTPPAEVKEGDPLTLVLRVTSSCGQPAVCSNIVAYSSDPTVSPVTATASTETTLYLQVPASSISAPVYRYTIYVSQNKTVVGYPVGVFLRGWGRSPTLNGEHSVQVQAGTKDGSTGSDASGPPWPGGKPK